MKKIVPIVSFILAAVLLTGCSQIRDIFGHIETLIPSNKIIEETRTVSSFIKIDLRTVGTIILTQSDSESLAISGPDNVVPQITCEVRGNTLIIQVKPGVQLININKNNVTFTISVKDLTGITVSGLGDVSMTQLKTSSLDLVMSGAGQIDLENIVADQIGVTISGLGDVTVKGKTDKFSAILSGSGSVKAGELESQTAVVTISGLGQAIVWVIADLKGTISGSGTLSYYGNPSLDTKITGLGNVKSLGSK